MKDCSVEKNSMEALFFCFDKEHLLLFLEKFPTGASYYQFLSIIRPYSVIDWLYFFQIFFYHFPVLYFVLFFFVKTELENDFVVEFWLDCCVWNEILSCSLKVTNRILSTEKWSNFCKIGKFESAFMGGQNMKWIWRLKSGKGPKWGKGK